MSYSVKLFPIQIQTTCVRMISMIIHPPSPLRLSREAASLPSGLQQGVATETPASETHSTLYVLRVTCMQQEPRDRVRVYVKGDNTKSPRLDRCNCAYIINR